MMGDVSLVFIILVFLFYAVIAGAFVFVGLRHWLWPVLKPWFPSKGTVEHQPPVHAVDQEHSPS